MTDPSLPPTSFFERLKYAVVPPNLYMRRLVARHLRSGEPELRHLKEIVPPDRIALDIGANKGVYSHCLAPLVPHVHAFEANPKIFALLARSLPPNVTPHAFGLSDRDGAAELIVPMRGGKASNQMATLTATARDKEHMMVSVPVRRLDSLDIPRIGFIKIDVEGHEDAVLRGAADTIARDKPVMLIELEARHRGQDIADLIAEVEAYGYTAHGVDGDTLKPVAEIDVAGRHALRPGGEGYLNNFVFLPA